MDRLPNKSEPKRPSTLSRTRLTDRDLQLLKSLLDYQTLTTTQIRSLFFSSVSRARKRLRILCDQGLLSRYYRAVVVGFGSGEALFFVTSRAVRLLQRHGLNPDMTPTGPRRRFSDMFLDHTLARNDFRIGLDLACRGRSDVKSISWRQGKSTAMTVTIADGNHLPSLKRITVIPDGSFELACGGQNLRYLVEIDRGTASLPRIRLKLSAYTRILTENRSQHHYSPYPFKVLWITKGERRLENLVRESERINPWRNSPNLFLFALDHPHWLEQPGRILSPAWRGLGQVTGTSLLDGDPLIRTSCKESAV